MLEQFSRTALNFGKEAMERLAAARVAVFGIGGVGSYAVEALVRSGLGAIDLIDSDTVCLSNLNRQLYATLDTLGQYKVDVAQAHIAQINPHAVVRTYKTFYLPETAGEFALDQYDYIVDAIDTMTGKLTLVEHAAAAGIPIISSMGAGNKLDPTAFEVTDIYKTSVCPLARIMRSELKKRRIKHLKVVYSKELPVAPIDDMTISHQSHVPCSSDSGETHTRRQIPGSNAFVPSVAGLIIAGEVVKDLTGVRGRGLGK